MRAAFHFCGRQSILIYFFKRLGQASLIVLVAMFLLFCMIYLIRGDPDSVVLGPRATEETRASLREAMGRNDTVLVQF